MEFCGAPLLLLSAAFLCGRAKLIAGRALDVAVRTRVPAFVVIVASACDVFRWGRGAIKINNVAIIIKKDRTCSVLHARERHSRQNSPLKPSISQYQGRTLCNYCNCYNLPMDANADLARPNYPSAYPLA